jgi:hypothetical protein
MALREQLTHSYASGKASAFAATTAHAALTDPGPTASPATSTLMPMRRGPARNPR